MHCHAESIYLRPTLRDAPDYRINEPGEMCDVAPRESPIPKQQSAGNFLRNEQSLVMRATRLKRFSEKYRDAVVRRVLNGTTTFSQIRQELEISEVELVDWIADLFERQQDLLTAYENAVVQAPVLKIANGTSDELSSVQNQHRDRILEGQVRPR